MPMVFCAAVKSASGCEVACRLAFASHIIVIVIIIIIIIIIIMLLIVELLSFSFLVNLIYIHSKKIATVKL